MVNGTARVGHRTCNAESRRFRISYSPPFFGAVAQLARASDLHSEG